MKQDEIKKIFKECKLDIYDSNGAKTEAIPFSRLEKFVTLYNQYLLSKKPSVSDCMKVQIVGSLLDLLTPTKEERKDDYNKAQDRGASTNSFK